MEELIIYLIGEIQSLLNVTSETRFEDLDKRAKDFLSPILTELARYKVQDGVTDSYSDTDRKQEFDKVLRELIRIRTDIYTQVAYNAKKGAFEKLWSVVIQSTLDQALAKVIIEAPKKASEVELRVATRKRKRNETAASDERIQHLTEQVVDLGKKFTGVETELHMTRAALGRTQTELTDAMERLNAQGQLLIEYRQSDAQLVSTMQLLQQSASSSGNVTVVEADELADPKVRARLVSDLKTLVEATVAKKMGSTAPQIAAASSSSASSRHRYLFTMEGADADTQNQIKWVGEVLSSQKWYVYCKLFEAYTASDVSANLLSQSKRRGSGSAMFNSVSFEQEIKPIIQRLMVMILANYAMPWTELYSVMIAKFVELVEGKNAQVVQGLRSQLEAFAESSSSYSDEDAEITGVKDVASRLARPMHPNAGGLFVAKDLVQSTAFGEAYKNATQAAPASQPSARR